MEALHHPFTAPKAEDLAGGGDFRTAHAQAYDLVLNGTEIGGERFSELALRVPPYVANTVPEHSARAGVQLDAERRRDRR